VTAEVTKQRALGFRHEGFGEITARIGRLKNASLRLYRERHLEPQPDIFEQHRRDG
jgi:hypothetical protein